ncbi:GspH/FimT family pseudopilin [Marinobacter daepoensis]|uniref:GspH/FimT family pseudopilin n=1 Tax=Marinobacter daepoensis TaxID=262077 RepID=UPI0004A292B7|nr:GspH/FimT family pseudopilin [Marinobacter daepoensis]
MHLSNTSKGKGFSLLEVLICILLIAIVASLSIPNLSSWVLNSRKQSIFNELHGFLAFGRWAAVTEKKLVTICPLNSSGVCVDDWNLTISAFIDADKNRKPDNNVILRQLALDLTGFDLKSRTAGRGYFRFNPEGAAHGTMGSLLLCPDDQKQESMAYMPVNLAGRFRVEDDIDHDGVIIMASGAKLSCPM